MVTGNVIPGPQRALVAVYGLFALAAGARSLVQITTQWSVAPLAYALSALAAAVYLVAALALARPGRRAERVALAACGFELAGVLVVGTASLLVPEHFPDATVWSEFGIGYGFIPLLLPIAGLAWLRWGRQRHTADAEVDGI